MRFEPTFRSVRMRPADGPSSGSETLSRIQSLADYTIAMLESSFRKRQVKPNAAWRRAEGRGLRVVVVNSLQLQPDCAFRDSWSGHTRFAGILGDPLPCWPAA